MIDEILSVAFQQEADLPSQARQAHRNGRSAGQYFNDRPLSVKEVVKMLMRSSRGRHTVLQLKAKAVLQRLARSPWRIAAAWHRGGTGGRQGRPDQTLHLTISAGGRRTYHLRANKRRHLFDITGPGLPAGKTYQSPGTPI